MFSFYQSVLLNFNWFMLGGLCQGRLPADIHFGFFELMDDDGRKDLYSGPYLILLEASWLQSWRYIDWTWGFPWSIADTYPSKGYRREGIALQAPIVFVCTLCCPHSWHSLTCLIVLGDKSHNLLSHSHQRDLTITLQQAPSLGPSEVCLTLLDSLIL